jgi:cytochrome c biogenesis protein CcmG/thiol:disulfide interchange protein DsbE
MRNFYFLLFAFALLLFTACDPAKPVVISNSKIDPNRMRMPGTNLPMPPSKPVEQLGWKIFDEEKEVKLGDMKGKVVILDFWATYCPPCIKAIPHLRELKAKYGEQGLEIVGLHVGGPEDAPRVPDFIERLKIDYPIATPEDELTYSLLGTDSRIPQTLIFDRDGKLVKQFVSYDEVIKKQINETVEQTINKK